MSVNLSRRAFLRLAGTGAATAVLAACAPLPVAPAANAPSQPAQGAAAAPTTAAPSKADEKISLTLVITGKPEDMVENLKPFRAQHPTWDVPVIGTSWEEYDDKVSLLISGGTPPAVFYPASKRPVSYHARRGLIPELGPYLDKESYDWSGFYKIDPDGMMMNGKRYGIPVSVFPTFLCYNSDLFDKGGVPQPTQNWDDKQWTWDEFVARAKKLTQADSDPMKTVWGFGGGMDRRYAFLNFGVDAWTKEDYNTQLPSQSLVTSKEFKWALQMQQDFIWKHKIEPSPEQAAAFSAAVPQGPFFSNKAAMTNAAPWDLINFKDVEFKWALAPYPVNDYGGYRGILYVGTWSMFKIPQQDAAWELLKFCVSPEGMDKAVDLVAEGRENVVTQGGIPARKASAGKHVAAVAKSIGKDVAFLNVMSTAVEHTHIFPAAATTEWGEIYDVAIAPSLDQILLNKIGVDEAVAKMDPKINQILAKARSAAS